VSSSNDDSWGTVFIIGALIFTVYSCSDNDAEELASAYGVSEEVAQFHLDNTDGDHDSAAEALFAEQKVEFEPLAEFSDRYTLSQTPSYIPSYTDYGGQEEEREPFDEDAARSAAEDELALDSYNYSYGCTIDCSGHEAGWKWRAENEYPTYGSNNYGRSQSFAEGARAYEEAVEDRVEEMRDDYESGDDYVY